jgi:hypothetical protein
VLVRYTDGGLTTSEYLALIQQRPPQDRQQVSMATDEQVTDWLRLLARDEILIAEARKQGIQVPAASLDSARTSLRESLRQAAVESGLIPVRPNQGETLEQAIDRQVMALLSGIVSGERNVVPLGALSFALRAEYGAEVFDRVYPTVVQRVTERRGPESQMQMPPGMEMPMPQPQAPPTQPPPTGTGG